MTAICYHCGLTKSAPLISCSSCAKRPGNADELAVSLMMTSEFLKEEELAKASALVRQGQRISLPPKIREVLLQRIANRDQPLPPAKAPAKRKGGLLVKLAVLLVIALLAAFFNPSAHYEYASYRDNVQAYKGFIDRFPDSDLVRRAESRIRVLEEDQVWDAAKRSGEIGSLRGYCQVYPNGKFLLQAKESIQTVIDQRWAETSKTSSKAEVLKFLSWYPEIPPAKEALIRKRIQEIADERWTALAATADKPQILAFLEEYPETTKSAEARTRIVELADKMWAAIANSRSDVEIANFLLKYPETTKTREAEARIVQLHDDWEWVRAKDSLEYYRRFLTKFPEHPQRTWLEKRIIDLEVEEIANGDHGKLPPAQATRRGGSSSRMDVQNDTGYELTVRFSGPESRKILVPVAGKSTLTLKPGEYRVAASVSAARVRNYYGTDTLLGGSYTSSFYIKTAAGETPFHTPGLRDR